jgi:prolyl oligopeptidase
MRSSILILAAAACASPAKSTAPTPAPAAAAAAPTAATAAAPSSPATPSAPAPAGLRYPATRTDKVVETHHGVAIADPYRWLEDMGSAETQRWVRDQNAWTDAHLATLPGREALRRRIAELISYESFGPPGRHGAHTFWIHRDGKQDQPVLMTAATLDAPAHALLDPNQISPDGKLSFAGTTISHSGARIAYGLAPGGGDWQTWHIRDVATGKDLPDALPDIKYYAPAFTHDGTGIYYSRFPPPPPGKELTETDHDCKVYFHRIGTPASGDRVVYERPDHPTWQFDLTATRDGRYLVITTGDGQVGDRGVELVSYLDLAHPGKPVALIDQYDAEYIFLGNDGPEFYFQTTLGVANKRIIAIDIRHPARDRWREVLPEGKSAIETATVVGRQLVVTTLQDAHHAVAAYDLRGKKLRDVELPGMGSAYGFTGEPDARDTYYFFQSFTIPGAIYRYDLATGKSTLWKSPKVAFDPASFETTQVFFPSKDGTKVPMFITAKKGLARDGNNPTVMTGYGFGGLSFPPYFSATQLPWLEHGGIFVVVNIRGGGEYGEPWHLAARRTHRQLCYDDFLAAGDWLVANHYTSPAHLGAIGTSGGGLLVGGALMQRPDLFGAVVPIGGVHDLLRFQLFGQGAGWQGELGSVDDPAEFATLRATSPLHNVRPGTRYPAVFVVTSDHDVRVAPLHSYKFAAALQAAQAGPAPIVMRVQTESGHGGSNMRSQEIEQSGEIYAFLAAHLGMRME